VQRQGVLSRWSLGASQGSQKPAKWSSAPTGGLTQPARKYPLRTPTDCAVAVLPLFLPSGLGGATTRRNIWQLF